MVLKSITVAAGALAFGIVVMGASPADAQSCGRMVYGAPAEGSILQRLLIEPRARRNWAAKVRASGYGASWAIWANARAKNIDCKKNAPGRRWVCTARGIPCKA